MATLCARCLEPVRPVNECICDDTDDDLDPEAIPADGDA